MNCTSYTAVAPATRLVLASGVPFTTAITGHNTVGVVIRQDSSAKGDKDSRISARHPRRFVVAVQVTYPVMLVTDTNRSVLDGDLRSRNTTVVGSGGGWGFLVEKVQRNLETLSEAPRDDEMCRILVESARDGLCQLDAKTLGEERTPRRVRERRESRPANPLNVAQGRLELLNEEVNRAHRPNQALAFPGGHTHREPVDARPRKTEPPMSRPSSCERSPTDAGRRFPPTMRH